MLFVQLLFAGNSKKKSNSKLGGVNMHERFTERASRVLMLAKNEAINMAYPYIGTEHLLLGLILEGES